MGAACVVFAIGDVVGAYTVLAHLRSGGMADLYLAHREGAAGFRRLVAIKVIHARHAQDEQIVRMFVDEARITARIDHPNVVHVEDLGQLDETYFLVMEYVHGCSLAQLLRALGGMKRRLSPLVAVAIAARVAEGLHAAHETTDDEGKLVGLVHRDVSPQNILLSHKGHVKLIDFGVVKARLRTEETNVAMLKGKVRYMPPEQATTGIVDRRSDVYSLGIVLWEMLTMRRLFTGKTEFEVLLKVRDPKITPPSAFVPDVAPELDQVVLAALSTDPDARPQSAKVFRRMLAAALPQSMALDSAHLADLLLSIAGPALEETRHEFPEEVSRVLEAEQLRATMLEEDDREVTGQSSRESIVDVMTIGSDLVQFDEDELDATPGAGRPIAATKPGSPFALAREELGALSADEAAREEVPTEEEADPTVVGDVPANLRDDGPSIDEEAETPRVVPAVEAPPAPVVPPAALAPPRPVRALWVRAAPYVVALVGSILLGVVVALVLPSIRGSTEAPPPPPAAVRTLPVARPAATSVSASPSTPEPASEPVSPEARPADAGTDASPPRPRRRVRRRWMRRQR